MKKIVFATGNPHKLQELKQIAGDCGIEFVLPPEGFNPIENGKTFEENSYIKAFEAARLSGMTALADDSGLCVDALGGAPGIYSARYAETQQKRIDKLLKELKNIEISCHCEEGGSLTSQSHNNEITTHSSNARNDKNFRKAKFVCAMTLVSPDGEIIFQTTGECHGIIAEKQAGTNGFGYDPIFVPTPSPEFVNSPNGSLTNSTLSHKGRGLQRTIAEMSDEEKNAISHRGNALRKVLEFLKNN